MSRPLFDQFVRTRTSPGRNNEGRYSFLNEAASPYWDRQRQLLNEWFSRFPAECQDDLLQRYISEDAAQSEGAFWELYLHETLIRSRYSAEPHPAVSGTTHRPDFLAVGHGHHFYLEAVVALPGSDRDRLKDKVIDQIHDELNKLRSPNFFLSVDLDTVGTQAPSIRRVRQDLEAWLAKLDPDAVTRKVAGGNVFADGEMMTWSDGAWSITFTAIPKSENARGKQGMRPVGVTTSVGGVRIVDARKAIRQVLNKKVARYGSLDAPYLIGVLARDEFPEPRTIEQVLFGEPGTQVSRQARAEFGLDGLFFTEDAKRVAGVIAATELATWTIGRYMPSLWLNPFSRTALPPTMLPWAVVSWDQRKNEALQHGLGRDPLEFFELPSRWPGPEDPFQRD